MKNYRWKLALLGFLLVAFVIAMVAPSQAATLTGVKIKKINEHVEIHVSTDGPVQCTTANVSTPRQALVIKISPAMTGKVGNLFPINEGIVERLHVHQASTKPEIVNLVVDSLLDLRYKIERQPNGFVVYLSTQPAKVKQPVVKAKAPKAGTMVAKPAPAEKPAPMEKPMMVEKPRPVVKPPVEMAPDKPMVKPFKNVDVGRPVVVKKKKVIPEKRISIDFVAADLVYVLKLLAKELNVNLVLDNTVSGSVTMNLKQVTPESALNIIVNMNNFKMKRLKDKFQDIIVIGNDATMQSVTDDVITYKPSGKTVPLAIVLENSKAGDIIPAIQSSYPFAQLTAVGDNRIIAKSDPESIVKIKELVTQLDVKSDVPATVGMKSELIHIKYEKARELATMLGDAAALGLKDVKVDERLNAILVYGPEDAIAAVKNSIDEIDIPLKQVMLDVKVVDLSESGQRNLGIQWQIGGTTGTSLFNWQEQDPDTPTGTPGNYKRAVINYMNRNPFIITTTLNYLVQSGQAKILASPRIATLSNQQAEIHIGEKYPIVYYDPRAGQYQVIYVDIGIKLQVKPTISEDGYITSEIKPTVNNLLEVTPQGYPRTNERSASTTIRVKDGSTIILGGLIREDERKALQKVWLLGDIPILGELFKYNTTSTSRNEVVILITPKIINQ